MPLPIENCLQDISDSLDNHNRLVIQAPPGAGKTTMVPLALLAHKGIAGRILVIQPRRLAVYGAAQRMAQMLNEKTGEQVGYITRFDQKKSARTRIEVITEGIFLRMIQNDPELQDVGLVIFDEFHERSVANDLSLAFTLESQQVLRDAENPLKIIVMSATLNGDALSSWLDAPLVHSEGRSFPVETYYHAQPTSKFLNVHLCDLVCLAIRAHKGSVLVFLPGMKEINQVFEQLESRDIPQNYSLHKLHASLPQAQQQQAIALPDNDMHKIVLTTNVAETSVTIEGIRIVIDSGLVRVARYDERRAMDVLVTEKISLASAEQRKGRAGRVAEGYCYRVWHQSENKQRKAFSDPEILSTDLLPVALELAIWGCTEVDDLQLLTLPDPAPLARAMETLQEMAAVSANGVITPLGQRMAEMGMHPRLAQLILVGEQNGAACAAIAAAAILSEGDPLRFQGQYMQSDLGLRLMLWQVGRGSCELRRGTWARIKKLVQQLVKRMGAQWQADALEDINLAVSLARAFPEHIGQLRDNTQRRYLLANGKGVQLSAEDRLAGEDYLVVLDAGGNSKEPHVRLAFPITFQQLETAVGQHMQTAVVVEWVEHKGAAECYEQTRFHHLILRQRSCEPEDQDALTVCLLEAIKSKGLNCLPWQEKDYNLQERMQWLHVQAPDEWPDCSDEALLSDLAQLLGPYLAGMRRLKDLVQLNMSNVLLDRLGWDKQSALEEQAPAAWVLPTGNNRAIAYNAENGPTLSARMQEFYGLAEHPTLACGVPLTIEILSPARRPIQITQDLPGFWKGSYVEVAKEMRGRYPKHVWPDDPATAQATTKTKRFQG